MPRVLVIDDNPVDARVTRAALEHAGFAVDHAPDGPSGLRLLYGSRPDVVLLDVLMPSMDGWSVCERIRELTDAPVIMLSALDRDEAVIRGLNMGADDFISKPVSPAQLAARVRAVLRRAQGASTELEAFSYDDGALAIDTAFHEVRVLGEVVDLTPTEFRLLVEMSRTPERVIPYAALLGAVWGQEYVDDIDFLRVYVWRLRKKIERRPGLRWIETERGFGYRFVRWNARPAAESPAPSRPVDGPRVLIVEDDPLSQKLMRDALESSGYAVTVAADGALALALAKEEMPALVIVDVGLPGMDGVEVTRQLRSGPATADVPVIAVTAFASPADAERMKAAGCTAYFTKPLVLSALVGKAAELAPRSS